MYVLVLSAAAGQETAIEPNITYLEKQFAALSDSILKRLDHTGCKAFLLVCESRVTAKNLPDFLRDVFVARAQAARETIVTGPSAEGAGSENCRLQISIEAWRFEIRRFDSDSEDFKFNQQFEIAARMIVQDANGTILKVDKLNLRGHRLLRNRMEVEQAQKGQAAFALAFEQREPQKFMALSTVLIAVATAATVFLLYELRSQ